MHKKALAVFLIIALAICTLFAHYEPFRHSGPFIDLASAWDGNEIRYVGDLTIIKRNVEGAVTEAFSISDGHTTTHYPYMKVDDLLYQLKFENGILTGYYLLDDSKTLLNIQERKDRQTLDRLFREYETQVQVWLSQND